MSLQPAHEARAPHDQARAPLKTNKTRLPALIRRLQITEGGANADQELHARLVATKAALAQIDALAGEDWTGDETVERMRASRR